MPRENWKPVVGFTGLYEISDRGRLRSLTRTMVTDSVHGSYARTFIGKVMRACPIKSGHMTARLCSKTNALHVLVLEAFEGPCPQGFEARHKNGDPADNRWPENLEWASRARNTLDRKWHELPTCYKLRPDDVREIKKALKTPYHGQLSELARAYGVVPSTISFIRDGITHTDIEGAA